MSIERHLMARRRLLLGAATAAVGLPAMAQAKFPTRQIQLVVPFPPGGVADAIARPLSEKLVQLLGQAVVVENRGGATGTIGAGYVAKAAPDGYTLLLGTTNEIAMSPTLYRSLPYDPTRAFAPVAPAAQFPNVLVVSGKVPSTTLAEFVEYVRARPEAVSFASSGTGSTNHLSAELLANLARLKIVHVPYKGGGPALADLLGGHVDAMFATLPSAMSFIRSGKLRALAVTGEQRSKALPDIPTAAQAGVAGLVVTTWNGVLAPAGTPPDVLSLLSQQVARAAADPEVVSHYEAIGAEPLAWSPAEYGKTIAGDYQKWSAFIRSHGITAE